MRRSPSPPEHGVSLDAADATQPDTCTRIAERLPVERVRPLLRSPVSRVVVHGRLATVETEAGSYEADERDGQWRINRFEPLVRALRGAEMPAPPVTPTVVSPELARPSLGRPWLERPPTPSSSSPATWCRRPRA